MLVSFQEIINSRLFKFVVGETIDGVPTEFSIYEEAIARLSKPLQSLIKSGLSEAQAGYTIWKDVSKETFELFAQFAYTGDYLIPKIEKRNPAMKPKRVERNSFTYQAEEVSEVPAVEESKEYIEESAVCEEVLVAAEEYIDEPVADEVVAAAEEYIDEPEAAAEASDPPPPAEPEPEPSPIIRTIREKYPEPPSLYILGDYRLIDSLKALALHKLHKTLCIFQLDNENVEDIINLARYAYSAEGKGFEEGIGELRGMVCRYIAENAIVLAYENKFMDLLGEGG